MNLKNIFKKVFSYIKPDNYNFSLEKDNCNKQANNSSDDLEIFPAIDINLEIIKEKYNLEKNSDINIREFNLPIKTKNYKAFLIYIDGVINQNSINDFILEPLLLRNSINTFTNKSEDKEENYSKNISLKKVKKFDLGNYLINNLIPQNRIISSKTFKDVIQNVNYGFCALFVDCLDSALCIEVKDFKGRQFDKPQNEAVIRGAHQSFVENFRINTSLIRKIINNEQLTIEENSVGKITNTKIGICYLNNIANSNLVNEVKKRINNLSVDYLLSSGNLEQLIKDKLNSIYPQSVATERPDRVCQYLLERKSCNNCRWLTFCFSCSCCIFGFY